ncbi:hypothetical protein LIER_31746 [Lithospermum erythrorhizon]|uniref:SH3 domain-containing protein n=1 Tax=Lithospermum erythrorhizon TaxID=34254 RepID=A0AAV3RRW3_LITER
MDLTNNVNVREQCQTSPKPRSVSETSLPLSFMYMLMIHSWPSKSLFFYECSFSKSQFIDTIIPKLKNSLSQTLNHFFILASKLIVPPSYSDKKPEFRFRDGDAVSLTFSESSADGFHHLVDNHPTNCSEYFQLQTERPPPFVDDSGSTVSPLLTVQAELIDPIADVAFWSKKDEGRFCPDYVFGGLEKSILSVCCFGHLFGLLSCFPFRYVTNLIYCISCSLP